MIKLENISKYYYSKNNIVLALHNINLSFNIGEFIAITGKSGSGKSTLLNIISGLDTYEKGKMYFNDQDITYFNQNDLEQFRKDNIAFVFQDYNIIESYTVLENVEMALIVKNYDVKTRKEKAQELINKVGLNKQTNQKAGQLSGGEKQRTVIARALAKGCDVIVCDEPTGNLDLENSIMIFELLYEISKEKLVIVVTHNYDEVKPYITRKLRLYDGDLVEDTCLQETETFVKDRVEKVNHIKFKDQISIAFRNLKSVPKKTFFTIIVLMFMISIFIFSFGINIKAKNTFNANQTPFFRNATSKRVIVTKNDYQNFTDNELDAIHGIEFVRDIIHNDIVLDTTLLSTLYNDEFDFTEFIEYKINPVSSLDQKDLVAGRMPVSADEVVVGENDTYNLDDIILASNEVLVQKWQDSVFNDYKFRVVGITEDSAGNRDLEIDLYLNNEGLEVLKTAALIEYADISVVVNDPEIGLEEDYQLYNYLRIDNSLNDDEVLGYDMYFFEICYDFGFITPDASMPELCPVRDWLIPDKIFKLKSSTVFNDSKDSFEVTMKSVPVVEHQFGQAFYVNKNTYLKLLDDAHYQISVIVYDNFEGAHVKEELVKMGYNVLYPNEILNAMTARDVYYRNVQYDVVLVLAVLIVYLVGFFVILNIVKSKRQTYLIYRTLGAKRRDLQNILTMEMFSLALISYGIVILGFIGAEEYNLEIPKLLRYFEFPTYFTILFIILILMYLMTSKFSSKLFKKTVITALRSE